MKRRVSRPGLLSVIVLTSLAAVLGDVGRAEAADEVKIELKDFKFRPPEGVENPDQVFTYVEEEEKLAFYTNGPADATFKVPEDGEYEIVVSASGDPAEEERPKFNLSIDEKSIGEDVALTVDYVKDYKLTAPLKAGEHKLTIEFINDIYREGEVDSNFYLHGVKLIKK